MNGEVNPNADKMGGFGSGKNYMQAGGGGGGVNMADLLPKDPFQQQHEEENSRWNTQSKQAHAQKQAQLQAEQDQFVPESFKRGGAMNLDIKGNKSQGKATTWLDNNSKLDSSNPNDPQNTGQATSDNQNNNNNGGFGGGNNMNNNNNNPYGNNNSNPYGNNNNNPYDNNNMNNNMNNNNNFNNNNNNGGFGGNNMNNNNDNNDQQNISFNPNPSNNNNNNGGFGGGNNNNMNMNSNNNNNNQNNNNNGNNYNKVDPNINRPKGPMEQPMPQPYYSNKQSDPFAKFLDNSQYKRDLKDYGGRNHGVPNQGGYSAMNKPNPHNKPKVNNYHTGNKESPYQLPTPNKFSQPIRSICAACGKPIQDAW
eukprot:CAMPEP_0201566698 /NCGR_PEP_ID=MMETSP0190_2-20130828/6688_1 /ASSEMBLY_ACC=CAM_ASM_000263 /TAXON_ID=37353 /ORGANISM="Rosalina sp." /LENGTH=364 /DNA_ID=CAMNT_0047985769 /DNA_START=70 /DNA_END=1161 /DNA_ORIENTATION=-